jgi:hypothetical protein
MPERIPITVAASVLADISLGIYRTPANALKELMSNSWDADATSVVVTTGFPHFHAITCQDDGRGMNSEEFRQIMGLIGGSIKRKAGRELTDKGRPIIGKIGIGILAVAQICKRFTVISSQEASDVKFEAQVDFTRLDSEEAREISLGTPEAQEVDIGNYDLFEDLPEDSETHYTKIILEDIEPGFRRRLLATTGPEAKLWGYDFEKGDPRTLLDFVRWVSKRSIRHVSDYNRLVWELGVICPVPYLKEGPVKSENVIPDIRQALADHNFTVKIDGLELRKPILFPTSREIARRRADYEVWDVAFDDVVAGRRLAFSGYFYHQRLAIWPPELRGLLVRIRNVAVGMYDKSLLNYPKAQGPRMAGLSGEIYVEEGLEDALNVDRNSFRETDPHYLQLQEVVYTRLGGDKTRKTPGIFSVISRRSDERSKERRRNTDSEARQRLLAGAEGIWGLKLEIESGKTNSPRPVEVDIEKGTIIVDERHPVFPRAQRDRRLLERVLIAYELANQVAQSKDAVRDEFYRLLGET